MSLEEGLLQELFEIPKSIEIFTLQIDSRQLVERVSFTMHPRSCDIYMKSFPAEERNIYQASLQEKLQDRFPDLLIQPPRFIYYGVGEKDWIKAIRNNLKWKLEYTFHTADYDAVANTLTVIITTKDDQYTQRNEMTVHRAIQEYLRDAQLIIEHVHETPHELSGPHKFLVYDEDEDHWFVNLAVWEKLKELEPIFQGASAFNGNKKLQVYTLSKTVQEQLVNEAIIAQALHRFGTKQFIEFHHIPVTLQEYNSRMVVVQE